MSINARATQEFVPIKEIRDGVIILKDGGLKSIILANSINLSLKSSEEQTAIIMQFKNFLNTLDFPVQINIQSRRLDIRPYLLLLENRLKTQNEPLIKLQIKEYSEFIKTFTENVSIMSKSFFIVVPYTEISYSSNNFSLLKNFFNKKSKEELQMQNKIDFEEKRSQLEQRVSIIQQGLNRCGVKSIELETEEIIELYYKVFNPGELEDKIKLEEF